MCSVQPCSVTNSCTMLLMTEGHGTMQLDRLLPSTRRCIIPEFGGPTWAVMLRCSRRAAGYQLAGCVRSVRSASWASVYAAPPPWELPAGCLSMSLSVCVQRCLAWSVPALWAPGCCRTLTSEVPASSRSIDAAPLVGVCIQARRPVCMRDWTTKTRYSQHCYIQCYAWQRCATSCVAD